MHKPIYPKLNIYKEVKTVPKIFKSRKKDVLIKENLLKSDVTKPRDYPSHSTEWINSIYNYNSNNIKLLPILRKNVYNIVKNYFNMYVKTKFSSKRIRARRRKIRTSIKRPFISIPTLKFTNDKITLTVMTFNGMNSILKKRIKQKTAFDYKPNKFKKFKRIFNILNNRKWVKAVNIYNNFNNTCSQIIYDYYKNLLHSNDLLNNVRDIIKSKSLRLYLKRLMKYDIRSVKSRQLLLFNKRKYEQNYIQILTNMLEDIYKKSVAIDIIGLKRYYNSSSIFTHIVSRRLKRKVGATRLLKRTLRKFTIPTIDVSKLYNEKYITNFKKNDTVLKNIIEIVDKKNDTNADDLVDNTLKEKTFYYSSISPFEKKELNSSTNLNNIMQSLNNKRVKGIRMEVAGRLTRRNVASRSIFSLKYKGSLKDTKSSMKGLPSVVLRGHVKPNVTYSFNESKRRTGAYGLKTWIAGD